MKKKWWMMIGMGILLALFTVGLQRPEFEVMNEWDEEQVVMQNKTWNVIFSDKIDVSTITSHTIYVENSEGEKQSITLSIDRDGHSVNVQPPEDGYGMASEPYTLHIKDRVLSQDGEKLSSGKTLPFIVKKTLPVIGSKQKLESYFTRVMQKQQRDHPRFHVDEQATAESSDAAGQNNAGPQQYSKTNNQVKGIDEPDFIKNDGSFIYQIAENNVIITKAAPVNKMKVMTTLQYEDEQFSPHELLLYKNHLIVIGHQYQEFAEDGRENESLSKIMPMNHSVKVKVYNIKDHGNVTLEREVETEGYFVSARRSKNHVYLITQYHPNWLYSMEKESSDKDLRPRIRDTAGSKNAQFIDYDDIHYFPQSSETNYTMVTSLNMDKLNEPMKVETFLGGGMSLYMSHENLYIALPIYPEIQADMAGPIHVNTNIYKLKIDEGVVTFDTTVEVEGRILNQFSMDEYEGNFRITTTSGSVWNEEERSANHLFIYDENLHLLGSIKGLAEGERIYSARFMKNRIYIVTFKQVDPLFVIDASDPKNPVVKGELKIPGFSNYLHPIDENYIIGFGQNTKLVENSSGGEPLVQTAGVKISMFDVRDMQHPKERFTEIIGGRGTYSPLNHDHKAMLYLKDHQIMAFPVFIYNDAPHSEPSYHINFQGGLVYRVSPGEGFSLAAKISHTDKVSTEYLWLNEIRRMVYIEGQLYSISNSKITTHDITTFEKTGEVDLTKWILTDSKG
ncbi:beta-propeller domain-containing protein [Pseudalkalibacillus sp. SCS-8]|uniref:beta-propeller domain-containing protein n=1 Tax=Pseudalkalibacillus nanhaiensis TaxID=3115291 RepID=UPI0032DA3E55